MTILRKFRDSISNWFDEIERGVGKRGSTFTDIDAVSHDLDTHRFLFREFKEGSEPLDKAQRWVFTDLAKLPRCTVWFVRKVNGAHVAWAQFGRGCPAIVITTEEYRRLLADWWAQRPFVAPAKAPTDDPDAREAIDNALVEGSALASLTAEDIKW